MIQAPFFHSRLVSVAIIFLTAAAAFSQAASPKMTTPQWQEDLRFMTERMAAQHPNLYRRVKKETFDAAARQLNDAIPTMTEDEIVVSLMKLVAMVQDGHTNVFPPGLFERAVFPVRMYLFEDGLFVRSAPKQYEALVGARVKQIGGLETTEALKRVFPVAQSDNDMGRMENAPLWLSVPQVLAATKISSDPGRLKLTVEKDGKSTTVEIEPSHNLAALIRPPADWVDAAPAAKPLYARDRANKFWFEYDRERKIVYVQQNEIGNKPDETVAAFYRRVMDTVANNPVEKLVIDLRNNDGGNNGLNRDVIKGILKSKIDERGRMFVITGRATFSAAQNLVSDFENWTNAIFVGEPTAGHPNHYGDARPIQLPNSKLRVNVSTIHWQDVDPRDNRPWTAPEIATPLTFDDYRKGVDPAMAAILEYKPGSGLQGMIDSAVAGKDITLFLREMEVFTRDPKHKYVDTEGAINRLGYTLLRGGRNADALEVFKLNARTHPNSANVHDSLGDGLQAVGQKEEAIKSYNRALAIDPNYPSSLESLRKLRAQP